MERKLAAILAADVVGYSALMERDEAGTFERLRAGRKELFEPEIASHHGRVFKVMGDGLLAEFASVVDAVECAVALQRGLAERNEAVQEAQRIHVRIGINLGEIIVDGEDRYGEGVNIATRLEQIAEPGCVYVSGKVAKEVEKKLAFVFESMGEQKMKNLDEPLLVFRVKLTDHPFSQVRKEPTIPDRPSVAVLPFTSAGIDHESGYFAEGVADDVITELSRNKDLFVVARHSSFHAAQENSAPRAVARSLGVRHILTGSVRRAPDRLRLSVHLIECETGKEVWAERYDCKIEDVFDVQLDIARTVTATIAGRLTAFADEARASKPPDSFDAYDHVLRAQRYLHRYTRADYAIAREHLESAIEADPTYARPYSLLCLAGLYAWFWDMEEGGLAEVLATGAKALSLDDQDAKTHLALGVAQLFSYHHDRAIYHFERAISLNPNDDLVAAEHGRLLMYLDRPVEGLARVREAMRLNPFHPNWYWNLEARCLHSEGRYEEAIAALERIDDPQFWTEAYLAACHSMCGRKDRAAHYVARLYEMRPDFRLGIFKRLLPYRNKKTLERFLDTFRKAGIQD